MTQLLLRTGYAYGRIAEKNITIDLTTPIEAIKSVTSPVTIVVKSFYEVLTSDVK